MVETVEDREFFAPWPCYKNLGGSLQLQRPIHAAVPNLLDENP